MSSYMMTDDNISIIANMIRRDFINGNRVPDSLAGYVRPRNDNQFFNLLVNLNELALKSRYGYRESESHTYKPNEDMYKSCNYGEICDWHYGFVKILDSYLYQCNEGAVPSNPLYKALEDYRNNWYRYLVTNTPAYNK